MIFNDFKYIIFFLVVFLVYWTLQSFRARKVWLLIASYFFYGSWDYRFLSLILFSSTMDYLFGRALERSEDPVFRKRLVVASIVQNLALLSVFKYFGFFAESFRALADAVGFHLNPITIKIILPVGISFFTFQSLSYTIDVYRRKIRACTDFLDFAAFVSFFPQLEAGPIVRAIDFLPQFTTRKYWKDVDFRWALMLFLTGFIKKACISDNLSPYVDAFYSHPELYGPAASWLGIILYAVQIYCDFSGYTDMAVASAEAFGFHLTENFHFPYLSPNITEFWRRWHISLSSWLRDYLYISLGGNRKGPIRTRVNLMLTMLLGGLWHGAGWNFVLWGFMHGLALVVHREWTNWRGKASGAASVAFGTIVTFIWVLLAWIPFRAPNFDVSWTVAKQLFGLGATQGHALSQNDGLIWGILVLLGVFHWANSRDIAANWWRRLNEPIFQLSYGAAWACALALQGMQYVPFVYFQF